MTTTAGDHMSTQPTAEDAPKGHGHANADTARTLGVVQAAA